MEFGNNRRNLLVQKFGAQWKHGIYVTVHTEGSIIIMYLFDYISVYYLLVLTIAHIILMYILYNILFFLLPTCFGWPQSSGSFPPNDLKLTAIN